MKKPLVCLLSAWVVGSALLLGAEPPSLDEAVKQFRSGQTISNPPTQLPRAIAYKRQQQLVAQLRGDLGAPVGYKVALTNPEVQKRLGVNEPIRGVLLEKMLVESGAAFAATQSARPMLECDLLVRVASEKINDATTRIEVIESLDQVIPFIEVPDMMFAEGTQFDGSSITALNAGARQGIKGKPISVDSMLEWETRLASFEAEVLDAEGKVLHKGVGSALMGHPLDVVLWLKTSLHRDGKRLLKGELLSLGTITRPILVKPGDAFVVRYRRLGPKEIRFEASFDR